MIFDKADISLRKENKKSRKCRERQNAKAGNIV
jgi:hypothetical protein